MTTLAAENPDVWITMLAGTQCTQIVNEAAQNGLKAEAKYLFMPQTCAGATFIGKDKLGGDGSAGDGWWLLSPGLKDMKDPAFQTDPYVMWLEGAMKAKGIDPLSSSNLSGGINYGFPVVQALAIAGQLARRASPAPTSSSRCAAMDMTSPMLLPGMQLHMDGLKDAYMVEGGDVPEVGRRQADLRQPGQRDQPRRRRQALCLGPVHEHLQVIRLER